jgi:GMP synthase-like glutamine amidotransferase
MRFANIPHLLTVAAPFDECDEATGLAELVEVMRSTQKVLAFRHVPFEHLGLIADALESHGVAWEYVDLHGNPEQPVDVAAAAGLIFMGGPMSVNDDLPSIRQELRYIAQAVSRGIPVLGVCLGSQLIAKALGARVYRNPVKEIGWAPVHWTEAAARDPLFSGFQDSETIFHWHGETFNLPPGAECLAYSDACRHQAFRVGQNVYGLQFHMEVTPEMISCWCEEDANEGDMREIGSPIDPRANADRLRELAGIVFGRWCSVLKGEQVSCVG